ncbi:hypothetical protein J1605_002435 [Eschrichtius robustus]|uniref:Uncharacterized protein n=1 Tax=Eschrichtius robustus TaxID=9764 RepID=A0AB34HX26_ESCRO|nr:hypothetical protein J1605_002435 [Eschrichtius robustus]
MGRRGPASSRLSGLRAPASPSLSINQSIIFGLPSHAPASPSLSINQSSSASPATPQPLASSPALALTGLLSPPYASPGRALQESLQMSIEPGGPGSPLGTPPAPPSFEEQLRLALELSSREEEERERRGRQEEEDLQRVLQLSLTEH